MSNQDKVRQLVELREKARLGGGEQRIETQHKKGKYTARERIEMIQSVNGITTFNDGWIFEIVLGKKFKCFPD